MSGPVLSVKDLRTEFVVRGGTVKAVDGVTFEVSRGRILGLVGESGSGKSVTGYSILGLIELPGRIAGGEVLLNGVDLTKLKGEPLRRIRGAHIAMVFQDPMMTLNPVLKISTQMIAAVRAHDNVSRKVARGRARDALAIVGIPSPEERLDSYPHQLSGGMRQRVAIATALLHKPAVIIADEPTTALDVSIQGQILAEVRRLADETGTAFVWITHDLAVVSSLADDICVMYAGRVVETGCGGGCHRVASPSLHGRTACICTGRARARRAPAAGAGFGAFACRTSARLRVRSPLLQGGTRLQHHAACPAFRRRTYRPLPLPHRAQFMSAALLDIDSVSKRFIKRPSIGERIASLVGAGRTTEIVRAVSNVSLTVRKGECWSRGRIRLREVDAGRMVAGIYTPSDGKVLFEQSPSRVSRAAAPQIDDGIGWSTGSLPSLNPRMRIGEHGGKGLSPIASSRRAMLTIMSPTRWTARARPAYRRRFPHQFSGGQRQRIAIARALAMKPDLLVLDEPVASLDVSIQAQVLNLFMDLRRDLDLTAIFISHDLGVVRHVSDRVAIMYLGRIVELAPTAELYATPNHPYTRALFESVPRVGTGQKDFRPISGEIPSPLHPPSGCHFHPRCPFAGPRCRQESPALLPVGTGRLSACHLNTGGTA